MSETQLTHVPKGFMLNAQGSLVPESRVKEIDKDRSHTVRQLCEQAKQVSASLLAFKLMAMKEVMDFLQRSMDLYDKKHGGTKGNVTLVSFDGKYKIVRQMQENIVFDERLQAAKLLIDECVLGWVKGSNANIKALINHAFQVDQQGKISTGRVLALRQLDINDPQWLKAMQAIADSMQVLSTKPHIRFYELDEPSGEFVHIALDVAGV